MSHFECGDERIIAEDLILRFRFFFYNAVKSHYEIIFVSEKVIMYGLILENMAEYIKQTYGEEKWEEIRRSAGVETPCFSTHQVYSEAFIPRLSKKAVQVS